MVYSSDHILLGADADESANPYAPYILDLVIRELEDPKSMYINKELELKH